MPTKRSRSALGWSDTKVTTATPRARARRIASRVCAVSGAIRAMPSAPSSITAAMARTTTCGSSTRIRTRLTARRSGRMTAATSVTACAMLVTNSSDRAGRMKTKA